MRRTLMAVMFACLLGTTVGCIIPGYSADPTRRTQQLLYTSEDLRLIQDEWERIWFLDEPSHTTPLRVDGGLM